MVKCRKKLEDRRNVLDKILLSKILNTKYFNKLNLELMNSSWKLKLLKLIWLQLDLAYSAKIQVVEIRYIDNLMYRGLHIEK